MNKFDSKTFEYVGQYNPQVAIDKSLMLQPCSTEEPVIECPEGFVLVFMAESNKGNMWFGSWDLVENHRGKDCWDTATLEKSAMKDLGPVPEGKTLIAPDCDFPCWDGSKWIVDDAAKLEHDSATERSWRNRELMLSGEALHEDFPGTDKPALLTYRQLLRDWPQNSKFPDSTNRPVWPANVPRPAM